jgi:DNA-binding transcriptional LysR family regulator
LLETRTVTVAAPVYIGEHGRPEGRLIELFPDWVGETFLLYALYPSRHLPAAKVRAFIDFVIEILDAGRA